MRGVQARTTPHLVHGGHIAGHPVRVRVTVRLMSNIRVRVTAGLGLFQTFALGLGLGSLQTFALGLGFAQVSLMPSLRSRGEGLNFGTDNGRRKRCEPTSWSWG